MKGLKWCRMKTITNVKIKQIEKYIDEHITEDMSLIFISEKFEISKYYLCHLLKEKTGYTLLQHIKNKRLFLAQSYCEAGMSLLDAAMKSGFKNYSSFYKACRSEFGEAPSKSIELIGAKNE